MMSSTQTKANPVRASTITTVTVPEQDSKVSIISEADLQKQTKELQEKAQLQKIAIASLLKKRSFTKTECSSTSIKLQWEHVKD